MVHLLALLALAAPFLASAATKLRNMAGADAEMAGVGLRPARLFAVSVITVQVLGSLLLFVPGADWIGAGLLAGFTLVATLLAHQPWRNGSQGTAFWEHAAIAGGLLLVAVMSAREV